ncbi:hypothetical protein BC332_32167 [Capsicum chinense]|nr:hypothetical protein BC332_32167 [Capsicum chinense]
MIGAKRRERGFIGVAKRGSGFVGIARRDRGFVGVTKRGRRTLVVAATNIGGIASRGRGVPVAGAFSAGGVACRVLDWMLDKRHATLLQRAELKMFVDFHGNEVNFYLDKGIDKSENDTLPIKMIDELPQQTQCDCGAFICAFVEYDIHGRDIPKYIDIGYVHMRTSLSGDFVIRSFMLFGTIHDVVLPTGRISP